MIRHIVLIRFKADLPGATIGALWDDLHQIKPMVPGMLSVTAGRSDSPEQMERGYLHGFVADFADWDALAAYAVHPAHQALAAKLVGHAAGGSDGILVFDLAVS